ncbi:MAG TPA: imidazole glycerol phosphate synthase subunit HisH [Clostridia bacterium]|nr:imidazole glycerol phosphate synthase subunit HisH [Clostridia bacterium]
MIAVVDYGMGNIGSVCNALSYTGAGHIVTEDPQIIADADGVILPGVGAFGDAMANIIGRGLQSTIKDFIDSGRPFLGICLGYQLLFESSEESPGVSGLGVLEGAVRRFPADMGLKVPHMGWNTISSGTKTRVLRQSDGRYVYFVHSYYTEPRGLDEYCTETTYGIKFASAIEYENILACQFHPEKSGDDGLGILKKWTEAVL